MKTSHHLLFAGLVLLLLVGIAPWSTALSGPGDGTALAQEPVAEYVGAKKCKTCHNSKSKGAIYTKWSEMGHAEAFETLGTVQAKEAAAAKGIADPQKSGDCLKCHTTAYGVDKELKDKRFKEEMGVQCESCHGPGSLHVKSRLKAAAAGEGKGGGILVLDPPEMSLPTKETCVACHNSESPTFEGFKYGEMLKKMRHMHPDREKPRVVDPEEKTAG